MSNTKVGVFHPLCGYGHAQFKKACADEVLSQARVGESFLGITDVACSGRDFKKALYFEETGLERVVGAVDDGAMRVFK